MKFDCRRACVLPVMSPPSRGAWIEMPNPLALTCIEYVAPLAGGVD